jgi:hypothetical protein
MNTKKITQAQFKKDVITELSLIKKHATAEERDNLDLDNFIPEDKNSCIYGLMAGHCRSKRAMELIELCCQRFVINNFDGSISNSKKFSDIQTQINGNKVNKVELKQIGYMSSLETFIMISENRKHFKNIFAFLKGETKVINL